MEYLLFFCRCSLAGVFVWAAFGKLRDFRSFVSTVNSFRLLPAAWGRPAAVFAVSAEVAAAALLGSALPHPAYGFAMATALLAVFTAALLSAMRRGLQIGCNCFGKKRAIIGRADLLRNAGLLALAAAGVVLSLHGTGQRSLPTEEALLVGLFAIIASALWIQLKDLMYLLRS